jgi:hypothetical protein
MASSQAYHGVKALLQCCYAENHLDHIAKSGIEQSAAGSKARKVSRTPMGAPKPPTAHPAAIAAPRPVSITTQSGNGRLQAC